MPAFLKTNKQKKALKCSSNALQCIDIELDCKSVIKPLSRFLSHVQFTLSKKAALCSDGDGMLFKRNQREKSDDHSWQQTIINIFVVSHVKWHFFLKLQLWLKRFKPSNRNYALVKFWEIFLFFFVKNCWQVLCLTLQALCTSAVPVLLAGILLLIPPHSHLHPNQQHCVHHPPVPR